jgi:hypothetical protein
MGKIVKVTCDGCGHDLTTRSNCVDYRLVLSSESKPGYGTGVYTAMALSPPVDRSYYFCDLECLDYWRARENHKNKLWRDWNRKWVEDNCISRCDDGRCISWPEAPEETQAACEVEFESAAISAFPPSRERVRSWLND